MDGFNFLKVSFKEAGKIFRDRATLQSLIPSKKVIPNMMGSNGQTTLFLLGIFFLLLACDKNTARIKVGGLVCEWDSMPNVVTSQHPRLGWKLVADGSAATQMAYRILVFSERDKGDSESADIWDSGEVVSDQSQLVAYSGKPLESGNAYFWKVKVWDQKGNPSRWSSLSSWQMAPEPKDMDARWIGAIRREDSHLPQGRNFHVPTFKKEKRQKLIAQADSMAYRSIMLRKTFPVKKKIKKADIYISGLGHYKLMVNGKKVGDSEFAPLWTDYDKTVYYNSYPATDLFQEGENAIGVMLGNGMYNTVGERYAKFFVSFGPPTLFFQLTLRYEDGSTDTINSDNSWRYALSPITFNTIFGGEDYDANLEQPGWDRPDFDGSLWHRVVVQKPPSGRLTPQQAPPVKVMDTLSVQRVEKIAAGVFVLDMGQNLSGFPTITAKGEKGKTIRIWVGEKLNDDGTVGQGGSGKPYYYDYTFKGGGVEVWTPSFSYYGFQYVQIKGADFKEAFTDGLPVVLNVTSSFIHNSTPRAGTFECSNEIFNRAHELINNAIKSNFQSVFTDCPHREKLGWLEETHLNGPGLFYNYHLESFIPKVMQDIADAQRENGMIPNIAPEYIVFGGDFSDSPEWGVAGVVLPWMYYEYYGDPALIKKYYHVMKSYVDYLTSTSDNFIVSHGLGDWYDYGDHAAGYAKNSPIALSATSHYFLGAKLVAKAAGLLEKKDDAQKYGALAQHVKKAFNTTFFDKESNTYGTGSQFSNAVPLFMELVEAEHRNAVMNNLLNDIKAHGYRLTTGDVGNRYLYQALARNGENEVLYKMQNHYDVPGYGFQIKFGLTTLTEQWDPRKGNSLNHFMMGQLEEWFYRSLAGITPDAENPGFRHFFLQPELPGDMDYVKATYESIYGTIHSEWRKKEDTIIFTYKIPANTSATVKLPLMKETVITVNGDRLQGSEIQFVDAKATFDLDPGNYTIESTLE